VLGCGGIWSGGDFSRGPEYRTRGRAIISLLRLGVFSMMSLIGNLSRRMDQDKVRTDQSSQSLKALITHNGAWPVPDGQTHLTRERG
jgi:hypothetical protein